MPTDVKDLTITGCTEGYSGTNRNGNAFTIYDITAAGVSVPLRSFDNLPLGPGKYEVEPYMKDGQTTYTLRAVNRPKGGGLGIDSFNALQERVAKLETRVFGGGSDVPNGLAPDFPGDGAPAPADWGTSGDFTMAERGDPFPVTAGAPADDTDDIPF